MISAKVMFKRVCNLFISANSRSDCCLLRHILFMVSQDYQIQLGGRKASLEKHRGTTVTFDYDC